MTRDDWEALLDRRRTDWELRLAYATWLQDEAGDTAAAEAQRYLAERRKAPARSSVWRKARKGRPYWVWCSERFRRECARGLRMFTAVATLADNVFDRLTYHPSRASRGWWVRYETRREAEEDFVRAYRASRGAGP